MGLAWAMVWILTNDHNLHLAEGRMGKGVEDIWAAWINCFSASGLLPQKAA
jgi:hypothetical protein